MLPSATKIRWLGAVILIAACGWLGHPAFFRVSVGLAATWLRRTATLAGTSKRVVAIGGKGTIELHEGQGRWELFQNLGVGLSAFSVSRALPAGPTIREVHQSIDAIDLAVGVRIRIGRLWLGVESMAVHYGDPFDTRAGAHVIALDLTY